MVCLGSSSSKWLWGYFLSRIDNFVGTYLALTGKTLDGHNSIFAKIGTHLIENNLVDECIKKILNLKKYTKYDIDFILKKYDKKTKTYPSLEKELLYISKHFNKKSIKDIVIKYVIDTNNFIFFLNLTQLFSNITFNCIKVNSFTMNF